MTISAKIIEDSVNGRYPSVNQRLTTFVLSYPRFIHAEVMTHRMFSRNASSSRAIPVAKMLKQVWAEPATPVHWGANQPGMQAHSELTGCKKWLAKKLWKWTGRAVCVPVWLLNKVGLAKQVGNRLLEPWQTIHVVLTATEFDNWFDLRDHRDAQPEIRELARAMLTAMQNSEPKVRHPSGDHISSWHLPFITEVERSSYPLNSLLKMSAARCARVSYLTHEGKVPDVAADLKLFDRLVGSNPRHASPVEHQAHAESFWTTSGNFTGFVQYRKILEKEWAKDGFSPIR